MIRSRLFACLAAMALLVPAGARAAPPFALADTGRAHAGGAHRMAALTPLAVSARTSDRRCTADGIRCVARASYVADVCGIIEAEALENTLDPHFLARLIWKESLFDAGAVSPAGALGIAQFMPGTAALRGLGDPFNPAEALRASARYLADLARGYGNIGLAAVAYNGGEARAERFIARKGGLPLETRGYVLSITGHSAETWRDAPPESLDLALANDAPFRAACTAQAGERRIKAFRSTPPLMEWGVIVASNRERAGLERQVGRLKNRHAPVLGGEPVSYTQGRTPGMVRRLHMAQVGRETRAQADGLCERLRRAGGDCMVLRN